MSSQRVAHPVVITVAEAFVCENPAVLRRAAQQLGRDCPPMLCTEGRPSTAFHRLAEVVTGGGGQLRYHGDFDWDGIDIAAGVMARHGAAPWLMSAAEYLAVARGVSRAATRGVAGGVASRESAADAVGSSAE